MLKVEEMFSHIFKLHFITSPHDSVLNDSRVDALFNLKSSLFVLWRLSSWNALPYFLRKISEICYHLIADEWSYVWCKSKK